MHANSSSPDLMRVFDFCASSTIRKVLNFPAPQNPQNTPQALINTGLGGVFREVQKSGTPFAVIQQIIVLSRMVKGFALCCVVTGFYTLLGSDTQSVRKEVRGRLVYIPILLRM